MGTPSPKGLVSALRTRLADQSPSLDAFNVSLTGAARKALLELQQGIFRVSVEGAEGPIKSISWALGDPRYDTVGKIVRSLQLMEGYEVTPAVGMVQDHPAHDLSCDGALIDIISRPATLRHHRFSDAELTSLLEEACTAHNANYTLAKVPASEHHYVLLKAQAAAYRILAVDSAKRSGLDVEAGVYVALAQDAEAQYRADSKQHARVLPAVKTDTNKLGTGDVVQGVLSRRSPRNGYTMPLREAVPPEPLRLYDPSDDDVEDTLVRLRWEQQRTDMFAFVEVWRDTQPNVERSLSGRTMVTQQGVPYQSAYSRMATSVQVLGVRGASQSQHPIVDGFFFWTASESAGSSIVNATFTDGVIYPDAGSGDSVQALGEPLEPQTDYYYRAYAVNINGEIAPSRVIRVSTKAMRGRLLRASGGFAPTAFSVLQGPLAGGTTLTLLGTNFAVGTQVFIGGKPATIVSLNSTTIVVTTPAFTNPQFVGKLQDIVIVSPSGLKDLARRVWTYT